MSASKGGGSPERSRTRPPTRLPTRLPGKRRSAEQMRAAALEAGRALLIADGPAAVTLKAVGAALGVTHANVLHHFGSAERFRAALRNTMVVDLTDRMAATLARATLADAGRRADLATVVDETFAAYAEGGIGRLIAWLHLNGEGSVDAELAASIERLMGVVRQAFGDGTEPGLPVGLLSMLAFAGSIMGGDLGRLLGVEPEAFRVLAVRLLSSLGRDGRDHPLRSVGDDAGPG